MIALTVFVLYFLVGACVGGLVYGLNGDCEMDPLVMLAVLVWPIGLLLLAMYLLGRQFSRIGAWLSK